MKSNFHFVIQSESEDELLRVRPKNLDYNHVGVHEILPPFSRLDDKGKEDKTPWNSVYSVVSKVYSVVKKNQK